MKKNNMRLIAVVMGEADSGTRNNEVSGMLDYGFAQYSLKNILKADTVVDTVKLYKSKQKKVDLVAKDDVNVLYRKIDKEPEYSYKIKKKNIPSSIKKGNIVGSISLYDKNNKLIKSVDLVVGEDVKKLNIIELFLKILKEIILAI